MPWGTADSTATTDFQAELFERGQQRDVRVLEPGAYVVTSDEKLGDSYDSYQVNLEGKRYECSCYSHAYGDVRRRRICGHVREWSRSASSRSWRRWTAASRMKSCWVR